MKTLILKTGKETGLSVLEETWAIDSTTFRLPRSLLGTWFAEFGCDVGCPYGEVSLSLTKEGDADTSCSTERT